MSEQLRGKLRWFLSNLDYLIEDYEFEKLGVQVDLYFDTLEVNQLITGLHFYYSGSEFKLNTLFQVEDGKPLRDRSLVLCLAYNGRLGNIKMLVPHQQEFLSLLNKDFNLPAVYITPNQFIQEFLAAIHSKVIKDEIQGIEGLDSETTLEFVRKHAQSAVDFFKVIQLVRGATWQSRLANLKDRGILNLDPHKVTYQEIVHSKDFHKLKTALEQLRPAFSPISNFADAVALTILISLVKDFKSGKSKSVPRFFVAAHKLGEQPVLLQAVEKAGLTESLMYETVFQKKHLALRDSDFFVFKATFHHPSSINNHQESGFSNPQMLSELRDKIYSILESSEVLTSDLVNQIAISGRPLIQVIDDINTFLFFKNVWMPSSLEEQVIALEDLKRITDQLTSESFKKHVNEGMRLAKASLEQNIKEYQLVTLFWGQIEDAARSLRKYFRVYITVKIDYFRAFGLLRFAFPESSHDRVNSVLESLLFGNPADEHNTQYNLISDCYLAHLTPSEKYIDNLAATASVLWVAKMYLQIVILLASIKPLPHFSLDIVYVAAILETTTEVEQGVEIIKQLEERSLAATDLKERTDLIVGLAYLYYHLWERKGHEPIWDSPTQVDTNVDNEGQELAHRAISYAYEAFNVLGEEDIKKKVYALNQYLFYLVMSSGDDRILDMSIAAERLLRYREKDKDEFWQYRFDDTLSRYFHRLANSSVNAEEWEGHLTSAIRYSQEALRQAPWDKGIQDYMNRLTIQKKMGFNTFIKAL